MSIRSTVIWLVAMSLGVTTSSRRGRAYVEFSPPVVVPAQEQVVVQARRSISLSCEGTRPLTWHTPDQGGGGDRVTITHSMNRGNKNKYVSTIAITTTVYKDTGMSI